MKKLLTPGRLFFAIPMIAFGVQHFVYLDFVTRIVPRLPAWIPGHSFLAVCFGAFLVAAGAAIMLGKAARLMALLLGASILASFALLYLPLLLSNPPSGNLWTSAGKALATAGGAFLAAGSLPAKLDAPTDSLATIVKALEKFIPLGRFFLAAFLVLCGIEHFIYVEFVAGLVPSWIPGHLFWTYFTGVALVAGGLGMSIWVTARLAAALSGLMIFLWVVLLHIPRAAANPHNTNEMIAVFEALAFSGAAFLAAAVPEKQTIEIKSRFILDASGRA